jgi:hypothetical protein
MALDDVIRIRCEADLKRRLKSLAKKHRRSLANLALTALEEYADVHKGEIIGTLAETPPAYSVSASKKKPGHQTWKHEHKQ